jgi:hypothetical protein
VSDNIRPCPAITGAVVVSVVVNRPTPVPRRVADWMVPGPVHVERKARATPHTTPQEHPVVRGLRDFGVVVRTYTEIAGCSFERALHRNRGSELDRWRDGNEEGRQLVGIPEKCNTPAAPH